MSVAGKNKKHDGGPAFVITDRGAVNSGMSLRDWFAGMALMGMHAADANNESSVSFSSFATDAYNQADAMLKVREKKDE